MLQINFRKFFCRYLGHFKAIYNLCDCKRYETTSPELEYVTVKVCDLCNKLAVAGCIASGHAITITYIKGDEPVEKCVPEKCCWPLPPPPPKKHKLIKEKRYEPGKGKLVCPVLIPEYGFNLKTTDKDAEDFADRFAAEGWGNFMRLFVAGNWEPFYQQEVIISMPYDYRMSGSNPEKIFYLQYRKQPHFDSLWRRAGYLAERYIMPMFTLLDNCSIHFGPGKKSGWWDTHWMNGDNNVNGTCNESYSQTHWYEYNGLPPHSNPKKEREGMRETGEYLMDLYAFVLDEAKKRFGKFFLIEIGNEIDAANIYHMRLRQFINERLVQGNMDGRVFTSLRGAHYAKKGVYRHCIPVLHGIQTYKNYLEQKSKAKGKHGASQDGCPHLTTPKEVKANVLDILRTESVMYEGNIRPLFVIEGGKVVNLIRAGRHKEIDHSLRTLPFNLMRAFGAAFSEYLG